MRKIIKGNVETIEELIDSQLSLKRYVKENGIARQDSMDSNKFYCPFHEDEVASMYISDDNRFKCFSCGRGGKFVKFYTEWFNLCKGTKLNYYEGMEKIAKENGFPVTQVFESEEQKLDLSKHIEVKPRKRFNLCQVPTITVTTLLKDKVKKGYMETARRIMNDCINNEDEALIIHKWRDSCLTCEEEYGQGRSGGEEEDKFELSLEDLLSDD